MKLKNLVIILLSTTVYSFAHAQTQGNLVDDLITKYGGKWPKTISFTQKTVILTDTSKVHQTWYEAGSFPNLFRIDFDREKGNSVIFNGDKQYRFSDHKLTRTSINNNPLIYLVGGLYFDEADTVKQKLSKMGVNVNLEHKGTWKGRSVRIIGDNSGDTTKNQLWYDEEHLYLVRFIQNINSKIRMDFDFYGHKKINNIWHEMFIDFYQNGKLTQTEEYLDYKTNIKLNEAIFDPSLYGTIHWLQ